jgi:SAM-dependent methyltransferase
VTRSPVSNPKPDPDRQPSRDTAAEIARFYDLDVANERDDIDMYLALASASDGPILELACGSGRICIPLAEARHDVIGVDIDPAMLDRAATVWHELRHKRTPAAAGSASQHGSLTLERHDVTAMDLGRRFDLVILGFNSLLVIGNGDAAAQQITLGVMARHLTADGRAVIDTWLPTDDDLGL